jgi:Pyruvate/2-oxoacid:ferredoxin oxidoreductase delta subunit
MSTENENLSALTGHPAFTPEFCINRRQRRYTCTVCSDLCPYGVFSLKAGETVQWKYCVDCGLCAALCPSRCFLPSPSGQRSLTEGIDLKRPVSFVCRKKTGEEGQHVRCLAAVPWEYLAYLALHTELVLYTGACGDCDHPEWAERVEEQLGCLRNFLGEERWKRQVHVLTEGHYEIPAQEEPEKEFSRRELFSGLKKRAAKGLYRAAEKRLPFLTDEASDGMQYRRVLARAVQEEQKLAAELHPQEKPPDYGVSLPRFNTACYGCGICEKLCPHQAIEIGPETDGSRLIFLTPWKCTGCELCRHVCPYGGITEMHTVRAPRLTQLALVRVPSVSCERCGTAVPPDSDPPLCPACAAKAARR